MPENLFPIVSYSSIRNKEVQGQPEVQRTVGNRRTRRETFAVDLSG